jgi:hypothetical protein
MIARRNLMAPTLQLALATVAPAADPVLLTSIPPETPAIAKPPYLSRIIDRSGVFLVSSLENRPPSRNM